VIRPTWGKLFTRICFWLVSPQWVIASSFTRLLDHTQRRTTVGSTPLDEWSARRIDLYLRTHKSHNRQTSMPPVGYKPTISAGERPKTFALDRAATGTGFLQEYRNKVKSDEDNGTIFKRIYLRPYQLVRLTSSINRILKEMWSLSSWLCSLRILVGRSPGDDSNV